MYTALLLVVLFERAVAMKFPDETQQKGEVSLNYSVQQTEISDLKISTSDKDVLHIPHDVVINLHQRCGCVEPTQICIY